MLWSLGIGTAVGLLIAALEIVFDVSVHPGFGGLFAGLAIGIIVTRRNRPHSS